MSSYPDRGAKANLKLIGGTRTTELRLGGRAATDDITPGKYLASCETAWLQPKGKSTLAILQFNLLDGKYDGVALRMWVTASDGGGVVSPTSRYGRYCAVALGRELEAGDPVSDPVQIFAGKHFIVTVGFRKTDRPKGGMASNENALRKKDERDFLRVNDILRREDL
jgi:hypothetical protein